MIFDAAPLTRGEKKALAIIVAVAVAFVVIVGGSVAYLTRDTRGHHEPAISFYSGDQVVQLEPMQWCDVYLQECNPPSGSRVTVPRVPVAIGETALLSVPESIATTPWRSVVQYLTPKGSVLDAQQHRPGEDFTVALRSRPDSVLMTIEVTVLSAVADPDGSNAKPRGLFAVHTDPDGFTVPADWVQPDQNR